jgi:hypothetical protein
MASSSALAAANLAGALRSHGYDLPVGELIAARLLVHRPGDEFVGGEADLR